ncbi:putative invertase inhibitor [Nicotiana tabacum]|uniref:Invertase inhibitor n=2 Tax=Nicotiana TaxID=4085 RepID=A0A1S3XFZ0_TOBAC|nr:PREDICTED: putative invertase inhibitor [Nicotiana sylvestris]XP_016438825.1 PREDICTED: putative invertase inhibitor [Nicotiana tabacum]
MWHCSFFSLPLCCLFLLFISTHCYLSSPPVVDLINSTCKKCSDESADFNYNFCVASLQVIPVTHVTNLQGIGIIAMELALENATHTISTIEKLLNSEEFDPFAMDSLRDCLELYADAIAMLVDAFGAFLSKHFNTANVLMRTVMDATSTCDEEFTEKKGELAPLAKENYNLYQLSDISWCIIKQVSSVPSDLPNVSS